MYLQVPKGTYRYPPYFFNRKIVVLNYIEPIFLVGKNIEGLTESDECCIKNRYVRNHQPPLCGGNTIIRRRRQQIVYISRWKHVFDMLVLGRMEVNVLRLRPL